MTQVKSFGILVEAKGEGRARHAYRRNRRHRTSPSPLIHTDDTDQEQGRTAVKPYANQCLMAETHANLGCLGMTAPSLRQSGITQGGGGVAARSAAIAGMGKVKPYR
jgi:hypothetical protein